MAKKVTDAQVERVKALYRKGTERKEIAKTTGLHVSQVMAVGRGMGDNPKTKKPYEAPSNAGRRTSTRSTTTTRSLSKVKKLENDIEELNYKLHEKYRELAETQLFERLKS